MKFFQATASRGAAGRVSPSLHFHSASGCCLSQSKCMNKIQQENAHLQSTTITFMLRMYNFTFLTQTWFENNLPILNESSLN